MKTALLITSSIILFILLIIYLYKLNKYLKYSKFQINDKIVIYDKFNINKIKNTFNLAGWNKDNFIIHINENKILILPYSRLYYNISAEARNINKKNKKYSKNDIDLLKIEKAILNYLFPESKINNQKYRGLNIDAMTETDCNIYLKLALDEEKYEIAELIKKQLQKYR